MEFSHHLLYYLHKCFPLNGLYLYNFPFLLSPVGWCFLSVQPAREALYISEGTEAAGFRFRSVRNIHNNQVRMSENRARTLATNRHAGPLRGVMFLKLCTRMRPRNRSTTVDRKEKMAHTQPVANATCLQVRQLSSPCWEPAEGTAGPVWTSVFDEDTGSSVLSTMASVNTVSSGRF